jgi:hypothetical protein
MAWQNDFGFGLAYIVRTFISLLFVYVELALSAPARIVSSFYQPGRRGDIL